MSVSVELNPPPAPPQAKHYEVRDDGMLYIGQKQCVVRRGNAVLNSRQELEELARLFTATLVVTQLNSGEEWRVKTSGVEVYEKSAYKGTIAFIDAAAQATFQSQITNYVKSSPPAQETALDRIKKLAKRKLPKTTTEAKTLLEKIRGKAINWDDHKIVKKELGEVLQQVSKDDEALTIFKALLDPVNLRTGTKDPLSICKKT